jgi:hypothetical protein
MRTKHGAAALALLLAGAAAALLVRGESRPADAARATPELARQARVETRVVVEPRAVEPRAAQPAEPAATPTEVAAIPSSESVRILKVEEGAKQVASYLEGTNRPQDVVTVARAIGDDPEMTRFIEVEAARMRASSDPAIRARGVLILAGLGKLDRDDLDRAIQQETDPAARALLVAHSPENDPAKRTTFLLAAAERDPAPEVRSAAVVELPASLDDAQVERLASILSTDRDTSVRKAAAMWFRGARRASPSALRALAAQASDPGADVELRREAAFALLKIEERAPGALAQLQTNVDDVHRLLASLSPDQG